MTLTKTKSILIVDDSKDILNLLAQLFRSEGYNVRLAANGKEALAELRAAEELPGLILLDLMMPEMDGYQFRKAQETDARLAAIPVMVMTADRGFPSKSGAIESKGLLRKPFIDVDSILGAVNGFFSLKSV